MVLSQKTLKDREREEKISRALSRVSEGLSYRQAAKEIGISFGTVYGRFRGRKSRVRAQEVRMKLSFLEETIIEKVLLSLICLGKPATQPFFVHVVNIILQAQGESEVQRVTRQWYRHFRHRHPSIDARDFSILQDPPEICSSQELAVAWFSYFEQFCRDHRVLPENIYAMDELGYSFSVGFPPNPQWQTSLAKTNYSTSSNADISSFNPTNSSGSGISSGDSRDGSSSNISAASNSSGGSGGNTSSGSSNDQSGPTSGDEKSVTPPGLSMTPPPADFFMSMETTCGDGSSLPPYLIEQVDLADKFLATYPSGWKTSKSKSGWLNEKVMMNWIKTHFEPLTRKKANGKHRILILDTHVGHFCLPFLQLGMDNNITFLFTPPHSAGLHPLEVSPINELRHDIRGNSSDFQHAVDRLAATRDETLTNANVKRSWRQVGLIPFDPSAASQKTDLSGGYLSTNPMSDGGESLSSVSSHSSPSLPNFSTGWPGVGDRIVLHYIPVGDLNFDLITSNSPIRRTSPSSNAPLFPEVLKQSSGTDDIVSGFSSFDLNAYAPSPTFFDSSRSSEMDNSMDSCADGVVLEATKPMPPEVTPLIAQSIDTLNRNKALGEQALFYHQFLSGFMERLQRSLGSLSESLKNQGHIDSKEVEHLALLTKELGVVDGYGADLSNQILPSVKANDSIAKTLERAMMNSITAAAPSRPVSSHKRGIRSIESQNSSDDMKHPKLVDSKVRLVQNPMVRKPDEKGKSVSNPLYNRLAPTPSEPKHFMNPVDVNPTFRQYGPGPPPSGSIIDNDLPMGSGDEQRIQPFKDLSSNELAAIGSQMPDSIRPPEILPSLPHGLLNRLNNQLPPLQFSTTAENTSRPTYGAPTSLAQYSQSNYTHRTKKSSSIDVPSNVNNNNNNNNNFSS